MSWTVASQIANVCSSHGELLTSPLPTFEEISMKQLAIAVMALASFAVVPGALTQEQPGATASSDSVQDQLQILERQVKDLQAQIIALKSAQTVATPATAAPAQSNLVANSGAPVSGSTPTLSGLLGSTTLSGFVDMYYGQNFNNPANRTSGLRSFDWASNQFGLNLVELVVDKPVDPKNSRTGYHVALGFGQAMNVVNSSDPGGLGFAQYLKEAYFSYLAPVSKGLQVDFGKFVTPHGEEVIETKDNFNYSRGLLFSYAIPYYHFGLRAKYTFNDKYSLTGYLVNGWNNVLDNNSGKTYGLTFGWNPTKKLGIVQNYMAGPEGTNNNSDWRQLSDTVVSYALTSKLSTVFNYDYGRGDRIAGVSTPVYWTGVAGYLRYAVAKHVAVTNRYEYYNDHYGFTTGTAQHLHESTTTVERLIANHVISRLEFRRDMSNKPVFLKGATPVGTQNTFAAGLVYTFDTHGED